MSPSTDQSLFTKIGRWVSGTPLRALDQAYQAAVSIKALEDKYFDGASVRSPKYGETVADYFNVQLRKQLQIIDVRLAEFRVSSSFSTLPDPDVSVNNKSSNGYQDPLSKNGQADPDSPLLKKLKFIDTITSKYKIKASAIPQPDPEDDLEDEDNVSRAVENSSLQIEPTSERQGPNPRLQQASHNRTIRQKANTKEWVPATTKTSILPRSILRTFGRLRREMSNYEEEVVTDYRESRSRTVASLKFLFLLAFLPLVFQIASKNLIFTPLVDYFSPIDPTELHLSAELEEKAFREFEHYKERREFEHLIGGETDSESETVNEEEILREKAIEIAQHYGYRSIEGIKNMLADLLSLGVFAWLVFIGREEIQILKAFIDQIIYGLSDSAKAFIIILFTDVFVGYHSPHGWEVLLEGLARHFGIPESRTLIFGFIATFPVFLDTLFKYWIFRYLNRVSPSAVATYKTMNE